MKQEIKNFIEEQLKQSGKKQVFVNIRLRDAISNYKLMLINPPKRVDISRDLSFIIEGKEVIFYDRFTEIKTFTIEGK